MSETRLRRSLVGSTRSLSDSEGECEIPVLGAKKPGTFMTVSSSLSENVVNSHFLRNYANSGSDKYSKNLSNLYCTNLKNYSGTDPSRRTCMDISTVKHFSLIHRFRWFLWKYIYLRMIKSVDFDVWLFSKFHSYGKWRSIFFILLPLLLYFCWDESMDLSLISPSYNYLHPDRVCVNASNVVSDNVPKCNLPGLFSDFRFSGLFLGIFQWFATIRESIFFSSMEPKQTTYRIINKEIQTAQTIKEEIRSVIIEILKNEIGFLKELQKFKTHEALIRNKESDRNFENDIRNLRQELKALVDITEKVEKEMTKHNQTREDDGNFATLIEEHRKNIYCLDAKLKATEATLADLDRQKNCCWKLGAILWLIENSNAAAFRDIMNGDRNSRYHFFNLWLTSQLTSHETFMQDMSAAQKMQTTHQESILNYSDVIQVAEGKTLKYFDDLKENLKDRANVDSFRLNKSSEDKIKKIVKEAIMLYDADKTGRTDYALESAGGSVVGTRCSKSCVEKYGKLGTLELWTNSNSPRETIQPSVQLGSCWAFKGSQRYIVLKLAATIYPTGFTMEHIPAALSSNGLLDDAPKNFSVWGLESENDNTGHLLGEYWYDIDGEPLQYFHVQEPSEKQFSYIELQIHSNHGNLEHTCLYRFRVHGKINLIE